MAYGEEYDDLLDQAWDALEEGRTDAALELCERAIRLEPKSADGHYVRGRVYWETERDEEARKEFDRCLKLDPEYYEAMLAKAAIILDAGEDPEDAVALCDRAVACDPDKENEAWAYELRVDALMASDRRGQALRAAERAVRTAPEFASLHLRLAWVLYEMGRFAEAETSADEAVRLDAEDAYAIQLRAKIRQRLGKTGPAERDFRRAAELAPEEYRVPYRLTPEGFDAIAREAVREIPLPFRSYLESVQVSCAEFPPQDLIEEGMSADILGVYQGTTIRERGALPDRIVLFQRNLENLCGSLEELRHEIRDTVRHEVGHHFGMSEDELSQIEYGSQNGH